MSALHLIRLLFVLAVAVSLLALSPALIRSERHPPVWAKRPMGAVLSYGILLAALLVLARILIGG